MAFGKFVEAEADVVAKPVTPGTVLSPFHGKARRFPVEYVVVDADTPDLPLSIDGLRARKLIA